MIGRTPADTHLSEEQLEAVALERRRRLPARTSAHLEECARCRSEVRELAELHAALRQMPHGRPRAGFAERVMARVRLPEPVSWRQLARRYLRRHRLAVAGLAGGGLGAAVGAWLIQARYPEISPLALAILVVDRSLAMLWSGVISVARLAYEAALASGLIETFGQLTPAGWALLLATLSLVGMGALRVLLKLVSDEGAGGGSTMRRRPTRKTS